MNINMTKNTTYKRHRMPKTLNAVELADCVKRTAGGESLRSVAASYNMLATSLMFKLRRFEKAHRGAETQMMLF